jgi:hypothetical protein
MVMISFINAKSSCYTCVQGPRLEFKRQTESCWRQVHHHGEGQRHRTRKCLAKYGTPRQIDCSEDHCRIPRVLDIHFVREIWQFIPWHSNLYVANIFVNLCNYTKIVSIIGW